MGNPERGLILNTQTHDSLESLLEQVERAETLGYEHVARGESTNWDAVTTLALMAERTTTIGLANDVFSPYSRSPALIGQTAATLSLASNGRYRLGLGASSPALAERWHGAAFDRPLRRLRETIDIIRLVMAGDRVTYDGSIYDLDGLSIDFEPPDHPPPIDVAALGPKASELAGRFADGWIPQYFTPDGLADRMADFERGLTLADRRRDDVRVAVTVRCCALDDRARAREIARRAVAFIIGAYGPYYRQSIADQGYADVARAVRDAWTNGDRDAMPGLVPDELLDNLVAAGTPTEVRDRLARFEEIEGVDLVRVGFFGVQPLDAQYNTMEVLAP